MGSLLSGYINIQNSYSLIEGAVANPDLLPAVSAGASGAVMGLGASLTVLALLPMLPQQRFILDKNPGNGSGSKPGIGLYDQRNQQCRPYRRHADGCFAHPVMVYGSKMQRSRLFNLIALCIGFGLCVLLYQYNLVLLEPIRPLWQEMLELMQQQLQL